MLSPIIIDSHLKHLAHICWSNIHSGISIFIMLMLQKWRRTHVNLKKGDLVILVDDSVDRNYWKMGRIADTIQSDEHVRHVLIQRGDGKMVQRDRTKLVKLELEVDE